MIVFAQFAVSSDSVAAVAGVQTSSWRRLGVSPTAAVSGRGPVIVTLDTTGSLLAARYASRRR